MRDRFRNFEPGLSHPAGGLGELSPDARRWYETQMGVTFYGTTNLIDGRPSAYVPGAGSMPEDDVPAFFLSRYGSEQPAPGTPPIARGVIRFGSAFAWWYGPPDAPPPGSPGAESFVAIPPTPTPAGGPSPEEVFPDLLSAAKVPSIFDVPLWQEQAAAITAQVAEQQRLASGGAPTFRVGDQRIVNGRVEEWDGTTWIFVRAAPIGVEVLPAPVVTPPAPPPGVPPVERIDGALTAPPATLATTIERPTLAFGVEDVSNGNGAPRSPADAVPAVGGLAIAAVGLGLVYLLFRRRGRR